MSRGPAKERKQEEGPIGGRGGDGGGGRELPGCESKGRGGMKYSALELFLNPPGPPTFSG